MLDSFRDICLQHLRKVGDRAKCLIVAEVAQTHDGSLGQAHAFIDAIAETGADAVKFQTHIAQAESTAQEPWRIKFSRQDATRYDYWRRLEFTTEQWRGLLEHAEARGLLFLSSPFSSEAVELLRGIGMRVWKVASGEITNLPLLEQIAEKGGPVILSSGMSLRREIEEAVALVKSYGNPFAVLQCTSEYPCPPEKIGLNMLETIKFRHECPVGLSDHSGKIYAGLAACAMGAEILEVHVTFSREMFGPDVPSSLTTAELRQLVEGVREIETMLAHPVDKEKIAAELSPMRRIFTKSVYAGKFLPAGTVLEEENLCLKKPGGGIPAAQLSNIVGLRLRRDKQPDEMILLEDVEL
jgi:N-acetylneuraminate synthase